VHSRHSTFYQDYHYTVKPRLVAFVYHHCQLITELAVSNVLIGIEYTCMFIAMSVREYLLVLYDPKKKLSVSPQQYKVP